MKNLDLNSMQIAITREEFRITGGTVRVRCVIPVLMVMNNNMGLKIESVRIRNNNIINLSKSKIKLSNNIEIANFIELDIPPHVINTLDAYTIPDTSIRMVYGDQKLIISFIGGDINHIRVIGRY